MSCCLYFASRNSLHGDNNSKSRSLGKTCCIALGLAQLAKASNKRQYLAHRATSKIGRNVQLIN